VERAEAEAIFEQGREAVVAVLLRMDEQITWLEKRVAQQDERIAKLEQKARRSSRNSSQPPSADRPSAPPKRGKDPSGNKPGGQPGHEGKGRPLLPLWAVDEVVEHWPVGCDCGHVFAVAERLAVGRPARHQVEELPVMAVRVTEHRCQRVRCPGCGAKAAAVLPTEAACAHGPRLQAAIVTLSVRNRVSRRDTVELCEQLFSSRISIGTVEAILTRTADALIAPCEDLLQRVRGAEAINMDETGWRLKGNQRAMWGIFSDRHAVLAIKASRHEEHAKSLLADSAAIVTSDRWWAYTHLPLARRQVCWSHLQRDFAAHSEGLAAEKELGEHGLRVCRDLFWAWEIFQHTAERSELKRRIRRLQRELKPILRRYAGKAARYRYSRGFAKNLLKIWPALWTFAAHPGVQPTNNHAERALRGSVIARKLSLGSQSEDGEQRIARLLSVHTTCRLQARSLHAYLIDLLRAHANGGPAPLLA
jgi:transposase